MNNIQLEPDSTVDPLTEQLLQQGIPAAKLPAPSNNRNVQTEPSSSLGAMPAGVGAPYHFAFGRGGRQAQMLNYQTAQAQLQFEREKEMARLNTELQNKSAIKLANNASFNKFLEENGINVFDKEGQLSDEAIEAAQNISKQKGINSLTSQKDITAAFEDPKVKESFKSSIIGQNQAQSAINAERQKIQTVPGGAASIPNLDENGRSTVIGGGEHQSSASVGQGFDPKTGMITPARTQSSSTMSPGYAGATITPDDISKVGGGGGVNLNPSGNGGGTSPMPIPQMGNDLLSAPNRPQGVLTMPSGSTLASPSPNPAPVSNPLDMMQILKFIQSQQNPLTNVQVNQ